MAGIDRMVPILEKDWPISFMWSIQRSSFLEGGLCSGSHPQAKIYQALCAELVPSLADKIRLEFAHHQNAAGMLGAYYHLDKNMEHKTSRQCGLFLLHHKSMKDEENLDLHAF